MIEVEKFCLENGLRVIVHNDNSTPIVSFNLLYDVGSRDEDPEHTGFAHLFEHLMFGGSINIPKFDDPLERTGGENNAFTNNDFTNYYITIPKENLETAFWLESDRMLNLAFSKKSLAVQKNVVVEEFNQRYLNKPYGDVWHLLRPLVYKVHPYKWPTIGINPKHIKNATLNDVKDFFYKHYAPNNAILTITGPVTTKEIIEYSKKWFGEIEKRPVPIRQIPKEPKQTEPRILEVERDVPFDSLFKVYHMCNRKHSDFYVTDLISDILSNGKSSRLYNKLVKEQNIFSEINAYLTGDIDEGLFVITGRLYEKTSFQVAESTINEELDQIKNKSLGDYELEKVKNQFESNYKFGEVNPLEKAMNLAFHELLGNAENINHEVEKYREVTQAKIKEVASTLFSDENCSTLFYKAKK